MLTAAIRTDPSIFETVSAFAESAEGLADLRLMKAVDEAVNALCAQAKFFVAHAVTGRGLVARLRERKPEQGVYIDPDGSAEAALDEMIDRSEAELVTLTAAKGSVDHDRELTDAHCDMLHTSFDEALVALARLIEVAKDMRAALIAHDLAAESRDVAVYSTPEALREAILH